MDKSNDSSRDPGQPVPDSTPIHDSFFRRFLSLAAIKLLAPFRPRQGLVVFLTHRICVKSGPSTHLSEASTMKFMAQKTSIPVPKVYCSFTQKGLAYIVMERIQGQMLARVWGELPDQSRAKLLRQLKAMISEMRSIPHPEDFGIANVDGGPLYDGRLPGGSSRFGPFSSVKDFHRFLRGGLERQPGYDAEIDHMMERQDGQWLKPVFTHGDLSSLNILVRGDEVVGIVDWEFAGWYPSYWEYTTAHQVNPRNYFWKEIDKFLAPMPK